MSTTKLEPKRMVTRVDVSTLATNIAGAKTQKTIVVASGGVATRVGAGAGPQGAPGPQGPPGPPGAAGGTSVTKLAAQALSGHRIVRTVDGATVDYCDADTLAHRDTLLGMTQGAAGAGASVVVQTTGEIDEPSWSWTAGLPVFCGPMGALTQTYSSAWKFARIVGWAQSPTRIWFSPREPITL